ncbi:unnamed protein product [Orchesella dallaii]|uniref:Sas10 C-terminal domain-containing protein n=1 Tax=Orchesella dallaii TaxID=48710 RepID=A0ABP1PWN5_9HEXA
MGKRRVGFKKAPKNSVNNLKSAVSSEDEDEIETHLESLLDDEIDQYNSLKEKTLLEKGKKGKGRKRNAGDSDQEEEVYGLELSSDEEGEDGEGAAKLLEDSADEDDDDDNDEDIFGGDDPNHGIPDSRAWGKKANVFHNTDYVDQDFGGFDGSDAEMAEQEETEAKEIQKRLTAELDEEDFLGLIPAVATKPKKADKGKEVLKVDFDGLSVSEKRKLIQRECPEVVHLLEEYKEKIDEAKILKEEMDNHRKSHPFLHDFYATKYHTILNYCINISFFLYLRATSPTDCKGHPVIKRILQFRRLLDELNTFDPEKYKKSQAKPKKLKKKKTIANESAPGSSFQFQARQQQQYDQALEEQMKSQEPEDAESEDETHEKRGINYTIAKNKGLTPYRKKELRNPRVKHRMKFRKATVRRKGQVRTARTETRKYDGELTGIKMNVSKSIKFK